MKVLSALLLIFGLLSCARQPVKPTEEQVVINDHKISIVKLDDDVYRIGNIIVDKAARNFEVSGKLLRNEPPIEFLAVAKGGQRGYESLLEFDVNVYEFNLACILLGLDTVKGEAPQAHFDPKPVQGDAVEITIDWINNGKQQQTSASEFFLLGSEKLLTADWVYTGSKFTAKGQYLPELGGGTLVGIVHDPASIIEHGHGFGPASYGNLKLNQDLLPPVNTPLKAIFQYVGNTQAPQ